MDEKIDFVITWVDESDPKWRKEFEYYSVKEGRAIDCNPCRYRNWDTLRYWFRGVEKYAPWVNKIFFVTCGHLPNWLKIDNPKLVIVKHEDFVPAQYLPTFNSFSFEFHFHNIEGLSDRFVYFSDDMFLLDYVKPDRFFKNGLPCDIGGMAILNHSKPDIFDCSVFLATALINEHFDKKAVISKNLSKWYSPQYLHVSRNNFRFRKLTKFPGFIMNHLPLSYLKHTYEDVWKHCENDLRRTCLDKFRTYGDVCRWLLRYWQLASGNFTPYNFFRDGKLYAIKDETIEEISKCIIHQEKKIVCFNDIPVDMHYEINKSKICSAFEQLFPNKSDFEL